MLFYPQALDVRRLREGLAAALERLPLFAGSFRDVDGQLRIVCDNSGIPFSVGETEATFPQVLSGLPGWACDVLVDVRALQDVITGRAQQPLAHVRVTRLADGVTAVAWYSNHAVGDVQTCMMMMQTWSAAVEGKASPDVIVAEDRNAFLESRLPPTGSSESFMRLLTWPQLTYFVSKLIWEHIRGERVRLFFSSQEIKRMTDVFTKESNVWLSPSDALYAHLANVIRSCDDGKDRDRWLSLDVFVDFKRAMGIDPNVVGNTGTFLHHVCGRDDEPSRIAADIRGAMLGLPSRLDYRATTSFLRQQGGPGVGSAWGPLSRSLSTHILHRGLVFNSVHLVPGSRVTFGGHAPIFWTGGPGLKPAPPFFLHAEAPGRSGHLVVGTLPPRLVRSLSSSDTRARLHRFRSADEAVPDVLHSQEDIL